MKALRYDDPSRVYMRIFYYFGRFIFYIIAHQAATVFTIALQCSCLISLLSTNYIFMAFFRTKFRLRITLHCPGIYM